MPTTYNGIGTHYYGKRDRSVRTAACRSCNRVGELLSYDTRLWFVVFFIPVIPLGRKRIIDQCPACSRHYVAKADAFAQAKQLQTSGSLDHFRREPTPEVALEAHGQLLAFHEHDQAAEFRASVLDRFPEHAGLRAGLAAHLEQVAAYDEAAKLYEDAYQLDPDLPEARVGVARRRMIAGELDEARQLLDFLEVPGAGGHHPLGPLDVLSNYYQRAGRHEEALALGEHLLREIPEAGHQHSFRTFIRTSEKALGRSGSILPERRHSLRGLFRAEGSPYSTGQRRLAMIGLGLVILAAGLLINNEYIRRHRTIRVINVTGQPVQVAVDDATAQAVGGQGSVVVGEGTHRIRLTGPVDETLDVDLRAGFFDRWYLKPAWVLNPGGEAVIEQSTLYYAANPPPSTRRLIVGQGFLALPHVDYPFLTPPPSLEVKARDGQVVKTALRSIQGEDAGAFLAELPSNRAGALDFAERRLRRHPEGGELLTAYSRALLNQPQELPRLEAFLKSGIERRPLSVEWHRAYQNAAEADGPDASLPALYDRFLASGPGDAALLYLRGRIDPDVRRRDDYYHRSIAADPKLSWPWMALAGRAAAGARWDECLRCVRQAQELKLKDDQITSLAHIARLGKGEAAGLAEDYRARLAANPFDLIAMLLLEDALAASGRSDAIEPAISAWESRLPMESRSSILPMVRSLALYEAGKPQESLDLCLGNPQLRDSPMPAHSLLALGRTRDVADDPAFARSGDDPWLALSVSLGFALEGRADEAKAWRERSIRRLESLTAEARRAGKILASEGPVPVEEFDLVLVSPESRALMFAVMGERFPATRAEYRAAAARFNLQRKPPYLLVQRAIAAERPGAR